MSKDVCVYILTHNRPNEVLRSLNSVRRQNFPNLKIVISDNSDNEDTLSLLKNIINNDARISYIRRGEECQNKLSNSSMAVCWYNTNQSGLARLWMIYIRIIVRGFKEKQAVAVGPCR